MVGMIAGTDHTADESPEPTFDADTYPAGQGEL